MFDARTLLNFVMFFKYSFEVEFSKPKDMKPIPEGTVKVYFNVTPTDDGSWDVEFFFENESLRHRKDVTMRGNMYESWINNVLEKKLKVKTLLHLGTEFESTRFVSQDGKKIDPFVPQYDITKIKNLTGEKKES